MISPQRTFESTSYLETRFSDLAMKIFSTARQKQTGDSECVGGHFQGHTIIRTQLAGELQKVFARGLKAAGMNLLAGGIEQRQLRLHFGQVEPDKAGRVLRGGP